MSTATGDGLHLRLEHTRLLVEQLRQLLQRAQHNRTFFDGGSIFLPGNSPVSIW